MSLSLPNYAGFQQVGTVGKPCGLKGRFFLLPAIGFTDLETGTEVLVGKKIAQAFLTRLERIQKENAKYVCSLSLFKKREDVESHSDDGIWVKSSDQVTTRQALALPELETAILDIQGSVVGKVQEIEHFGASYNLSIFHPKKGNLDLPFIPENFQWVDEGSQLQLKLPVEHFQDYWQ